MGKLAQIEILDKSKGYHVIGHVDSYIRDIGTNSVVMASLIGYDSVVKACSAAMVCGHSCRLNGGYSWCRSDGYRLYSGKAGDFSHTIVLSSDAVDDKAEKPVLIAWDGDKEEALYATLQRRYPIPVMREWMPWLWERMVERALAEELSCWTATAQPMEAFRLILTEADLTNLIGEGLRSKAISFCMISGKSGPKITDVEGLDDYLRGFGQTLAEKIARDFRPLHDPKADPLSPLLKKLKRKPFRAQADVIQGTMKVLDQYRSAIVVGEMGTGKTNKIGRAHV